MVLKFLLEMDEIEPFKKIFQNKFIPEITFALVYTFLGLYGKGKNIKNSLKSMH